jgi:hypothetical protein
MDYKIISVDSPVDGSATNHVIIDFGDGAFKSFPAVEGNPEFDAFIAANPDALKKAPKPPAPAEKTPSDPAA